MPAPDENPTTLDEATAARNAARFRQANESIKDVVAASQVVLASVPFICECSDPNCRGLIGIPLETYAEIRASPRRFLVLPGHEQSAGERVIVERHDEFVVVEKQGLAGELAEANADEGREDG